MIEGNKLHERLKKTLIRNVPSYIDKPGNFMVASVSLIAWNATSSRNVFSDTTHKCSF